MELSDFILEGLDRVGMREVEGGDRSCATLEIVLYRYVAQFFSNLGMVSHKSCYGVNNICDTFASSQRGSTGYPSRFRFGDRDAVG